MQQGCTLDEAYGQFSLGMDLSKDIEAAMTRLPISIQTNAGAIQTQRQNEFTLGSGPADFAKQGLIWQSQIPTPAWQPRLPEKTAPAQPMQKEPMTVERIASMLVNIMQRLDELQTPRPKPTQQATDIIMFLMVGLFLIFAIDACSRAI